MGSSGLLDRAVYGVGQAADLLGMRSTKVKAWLDGYVRKGVEYPPVVRARATGSDLVTWGEFVELGYLREYRNAGVSLQSIRPVIADLRERYRTAYPLAQMQPYVSDRELVLQLQSEHGVDPAAWMVVRTGQGIMLAERADRFFRKIEFDPNQTAQRLMPAGQTSPVRLDPEVAFGMPAVEGIATERLYEVWSAEGEDVRWVARSYGLEEATVSAAVAYEAQQLTMAA